MRVSDEHRGAWFAETVSVAVSVAAPEWMAPAEKQEMASVCIAAATRYVRQRNLVRQAARKAAEQSREGGE